MKKTNFLMLLMTFIMLCISTQALSQDEGTGIGTLNPHPSAALDVVNTKAGVLIPRMDVNQKNAIASPATGLLVYDTTSQCISQNTGTPTVPVWVCLSAKDKQNSFFYMPSMAIDASKVGEATPLDLYAEYKKQFNTPAARSLNAPSSIPYFPKATDLYYYISQYDKSVIQMDAISEEGKMSYKIIKEAKYASFMNVVFVIK
ncbi:hypothetical protein OIU80_20275 [Flavobacterium sp. LS1R47]|uniref:Uncharacterized protein n=1 Tax=Flavobacterium frigoritolerans TaxID=2987686 RepID=A0A9X3HND0_9FLAO|nr:hypothetical protein [Flavobacterium frigoritolerans]MCV9934626.1 hypothetical protein [Flavobacterium frigoritolerans]